MWVDRPFGQLLTLFDLVTLEHDDVFTDRDEMLLFLLGFNITDNDGALASYSRAKINLAVDPGNLGTVLRLACLEQLRYTRQTTGDVLGLGGLSGCLGDQAARNDGVSLLHDDMRPGRDRIVRDRFTLAVGHDDLRMQIFLVVDDHQRQLAGGFVHLLLDGHTLDDVVEFDRTRFLGDNRHVIRIPLDEHFALLDLAAVRNRDHGADDDIVAFQFVAGFFVNDEHHAVLVEDDIVAILQFHLAEVLILQHTRVASLNLRLLKHGGGGTADVERTHGQLRTRFTDRLRSDDADCLTHGRQVAGGQVDAVAFLTDTALGFAGQHGTNPHPLHAGVVD